MFRFLRLYYNYFLVKLGYRKVLPSYFTNRTPIIDCGDELVQYQDIWMRKCVAVMLDNAQRSLPPNFALKVVSGFSSDNEPHILQQKFSDCKKVATESGHFTGGAVNVTLHYCGKEIDCGGQYFSFSSSTPTWSKELNQNQRYYRFILYKVMTDAGFVNYPLEWWHFCYGDKMYAAYKFEKKAIYGKTTICKNL